jgi:hypothetical protein
MSATIVRVDRLANLGIFRVTFATMPERSDLTQVGRKAAAGAAHTLVGAAQNVSNRGSHWTADYAPLSRKSKAAAPEVAQAPEVTGDDRLAYLERELARVTALLADSRVGDVKVADAVAREVPPVIAAKIAASRAIVCKSCRDLGVVRGVGKNAGQPYRTADGAAAATAAGRAVKCTGKAHKAA